MKRLTALIVLAVVVAGCSGESAPVVDLDSGGTLPPVSTLDTQTTTTSSTTTTDPPTTTSANQQPPALDVAATPAAETGYLVTITGSTDTDSTVTLDGEEVGLSGGSFEVATLSSPGLNEHVVIATDPDGVATTEIISWSWEPPVGWAAGIGDSVMLGSQAEIEKRLGEQVVDATVSRQFLEAPELVAELLARPVPPELIVIGLGTNGPVQDRHFDAVMEIAADVPLVAFVNVRVPRSWESASNTALAEGVGRYDNAVLVDWWTPTHDRDDLFAADGFHPKQPGRVIMAELIASAVYPDWTPLEE